MTDAGSSYWDVAEVYRGEKPLMTKLAPTFALADVARHATAGTAAATM